MPFVERILAWVSTRLHIARIKCKINLYREKIKSDNGNYQLGENVNMMFPENIFIGDNSYINGGDIMASPNAKIVIGKNCLISYFVHMRTDMHNHSKHELICEQGHTEKDIIIGDDVWIGYGAQILSGVVVADGCIIAAGAVVTKNTEPYCVYAGVPARKVNKRD